eukprot:TRINITY_DN1242_c0_g1_i1.p1 TRINITY_DN1242_c0_g1~~TRINITY_DN1242_c0_g1_i1.p1  ORF type:complete len:326 (+),score=61.74 TRINITY_DN1242_c0_g1_i1:17-994(+)
MKATLLLLATILFAFSQASFGAVTVYSLSQAEKDEFVNIHNQFRSEVNPPPASPLNQVSWDETLAQAAANFYTNCLVGHSGLGYGENLYWTSNPNPGVNWPTQVVTAWNSEKTDYTYDTNSCAPGKVCGHYTQVVWNNSIKIGCVRINGCSPWAVSVACEYSPPGNYIGQYPYIRATSAVSASASPAAVSKTSSLSRSRPISLTSSISPSALLKPSTSTSNSKILIASKSSSISLTRSISRSRSISLTRSRSFTKSRSIASKSRSIVSKSRSISLTRSRSFTKSRSIASKSRSIVSKSRSISLTRSRSFTKSRSISFTRSRSLVK